MAEIDRTQPATTTQPPHFFFGEVKKNPNLLIALLSFAYYCSYFTSITCKFSQRYQQKQKSIPQQI